MFMKKIIVYTMDYCPYCDSAKKLLKSKGLSFEEIKLAEDDDQAWIDLEKRTKFKTVPQIFIGDAFIGGFSELSKLNQKGELDRLLA